MTQPQPQPVRPIADALMAEIAAEQDAKGLAKYGVPLSSHNGRDARRDLLQELYDAIGYGTQLGEELAYWRDRCAEIEARNARLEATNAKLSSGMMKLSLRATLAKAHEESKLSAALAPKTRKCHQGAKGRA